MSALDPRTADRLARICGLFSSDQDGMADKILRTWADILVPNGGARADTIEDQIEFALANDGALTEWEKDFLHSIQGRHSLSIRQRQVVDKIIRKIRGAP